MQLRLLEYFAALARERHFARAADACHVTQPTLSAGIAALETALGQRLVERDRRFIGLTPEGSAVLPWAQQVIAGCRNLALAATAGPGEVQGELRLGTIPACQPMVGRFARALRQLYPHMTLSIRSGTSRDLERALAAHELDAGLTYLEHEPPAHVLSVPLYRERMAFVALARESDEPRTTIGWDEALAHPLCLLHQGMQNRRILDAQLARRGLAVHPVATADSYVTLLSMVRSGDLASIVPDSYVSFVPAWARTLAFDDPLPATGVGLVVADRVPLGALARAALSAAGQIPSTS